MILLAFLLGCTNPETATRILEQQGYSEIRITGYRWTGCSEEDTYSTGFTAKAQNGTISSGVVCQGLLFKGATVRFD